MFDRLAPAYDFMNSLMSAGLHHRWRARAVSLAALRRGASALDVATGTGDLAFALADAVGPEGEVIGCDFATGMLAQARAKAARQGRRNVHFQTADALDLPFPDNRFDGATVAFGLRNFAEPERGLEEMVRVVKPGGRVVVLELTPPQRGWFARFYGLWLDRTIPLLGSLTPNPAAYAYLPRSVRAFLPPTALAAKLAAAQLAGVHGVVLAGGIVTICAGTVSR